MTRTLTVHIYKFTIMQRLKLAWQALTRDAIVFGQGPQG